MSHTGLVIQHLSPFLIVSEIQPRDWKRQSSLLFMHSLTILMRTRQRFSFHYPSIEVWTILCVPIESILMGVCRPLDYLTPFPPSSPPFLPSLSLCLVLFLSFPTPLPTSLHSTHFLASFDWRETRRNWESFSPCLSHRWFIANCWLFGCLSCSFFAILHVDSLALLMFQPISWTWPFSFNFVPFDSKIGSIFHSSSV